MIIPEADLKYSVAYVEVGGVIQPLVPLTG